MVQHRIQRTSFPRANREGLGESMRVLERQHLVLAVAELDIVYELVEESRCEMEYEYINRLLFTAAAGCGQFGTVGAAFFSAIAVAGNAVPELQVIIGSLAVIVMVYQHAGIFRYPGRLCIIPADTVLDRPRDMLFLFKQQVEGRLRHALLPLSEYVHYLYHQPQN